MLLILLASLFVSHTLLIWTNRALIRRRGFDELQRKMEEIAVLLLAACFEDRPVDVPEEPDDLVLREAWRPFQRLCK